MTEEKKVVDEKELDEKEMDEVSGGLLCPDPKVIDDFNQKAWK